MSSSRRRARRRAVPRCPKARLISGDPAEVPERCRTEKPVLTDTDHPNHQVARWYLLEPGDNERMREIQTADITVDCHAVDDVDGDAADAHVPDATDIKDELADPPTGL